MSNEQKIDAYKAVAKSSVIVNTEGQECGTLDLSKQEIYTTSQLKAQDKRIKDLLKNGTADLKLPVFVFEKDGQTVTVIPCYGAGLWGPIKDDPSFRAEFEGKKIDFEDEEAFRVVKGGAPAGKENAVDAISGASITSHALGVSIDNWLQAYKPFLKAAAAKAVQPSEVENAADSLCVSADSLAIAK